MDRDLMAVLLEQVDKGDEQHATLHTVTAGLMPAAVSS